MRLKLQANLALSIVLCTLLFCKSTAVANQPAEPNLDHNHINLNVVHILQVDDYSCATTSAAMAISYFEKKTLNKNAVWKISGSNISEIKKQGNDMNGLKKIADHYGYESEFIEGLSFRDIEKFISQGIPVVINILQRAGGNATHAVLVVGYDANEKIFFVNDPKPSIIGNSISYKKLNRLWTGHLSHPYKMSYRSGFIIYPKGDIRERDLSSRSVRNVRSWLYRPEA